MIGGLVVLIPRWRAAIVGGGRFQIRAVHRGHSVRRAAEGEREDDKKGNEMPDHGLLRLLL